MKLNEKRTQVKTTKNMRKETECIRAKKKNLN